MGDRKRTAAREVVVPLYDCEAAYALMSVMKSMNPGPGKPGPEDEWRVPLGPANDVVADRGVVDDSVGEGRGGWLRRFARRS